MKIIVAGIGGVGGYFGGLLAKKFHNHPSIKINFLARGNHLKSIQKNGLTILNKQTSFIAKPNLATDNASEIGKADLIILCTKSFDLEQIIGQLSPCIDNNTLILPLLNGVDNKDRIKKLLPQNLVLDACVYIVSRLKNDGIVENIGNIQSLYFGIDNYTNDHLSFLEKLFLEANIEATLSRNISSLIWEKFIFLSPIATITSYYDRCIGEILANKQSLADLMILIDEVRLIALKKNIEISEHIVEKTLLKLKNLPFEATSSMHSDFRNKKPNTEIESLTNFVILEGEKLQISTPMFVKMYQNLKLK